MSRNNKLKVALVCPNCGCNDHLWSEAYIEENSMLKKLKNNYISWCIESNSFVIKNNLIDTHRTSKNRLLRLNVS
jgi:hypothetical protein